MTNYNPETHRKWYVKNAAKKRAYSQVYYEANKEKRIAYAKQRRETNPKEWWPSHLKRLYGLTVAEFETLRAAQDNRCGVCKVEFDESRKGKTPHVDHCHATGRVRGLLCGPCNTSLGHLERPGFYEAAQAYLNSNVN